MSLQRIEIRKQFSASVDMLFSYLSVHKNLETIFAPAKISRIKDGSDAPDGLGSVRRMRILIAPPFEETVTAHVPNERIEYRITRGSPLRNHMGVMRFAAMPAGGSELHYTIEFEGRLPLIGPLVRAGLERGIRRGLDKLPL